MGFASSPATRDALSRHGIRVTGWTWRWGLGLKGGTFPPHRDINGEHQPTADSFAALPGEDVNGDTCMCNLVPVYRTSDGRFARPGLQPVFQPPVTASLVPACVHESEPLDFTPLIAAMRDTPPTYVNVSAPDVHIPEIRMPDIRIPDFPAFPEFALPAFPEMGPINVAAPNVQVTVQADTKPPVESVYFAGINGTVKVPKTHVIVAVSAECQDKAGSVKIGSGATIPVPKNTAWSDEFDDAPMKAASVVFKNTVAYYIRAVPA